VSTRRSPPRAEREAGQLGLEHHLVDPLPRSSQIPIRRMSDASASLRDMLSFDDIINQLKIQEFLDVLSATHLVPKTLRVVVLKGLEGTIHGNCIRKRCLRKPSCSALPCRDC